MTRTNLKRFLTRAQAKVADLFPVTVNITGVDYAGARGAIAERVIYNEQSGTNLLVTSCTVSIARALLVSAVEAIVTGSTAATVTDADTGRTMTGTIIKRNLGAGEAAYELEIESSSDVPSV